MRDSLDPSGLEEKAGVVRGQLALSTAALVCLLVVVN